MFGYGEVVWQDGYILKRPKDLGPGARPTYGYVRLLAELPHTQINCGVLPDKILDRNYGQFITRARGFISLTIFAAAIFSQDNWAVWPA